MRGLEKINAVALGLILWIVLILSALQFTAFNLDFYKEQYTFRNTAAMIGVSQNDLLTVTDVLLDYTSGQRSDMNVEVSIGGVVQPYYNQREIDHMVDVRNLYLNVLQIRDILFVFALINIVVLAVFRRKAIIPMLQFGLTWVSIGFGLILLSLGTFAVIDFNAFWTAFHKVFFTNDLWLLDPNTDNLINMVPEGFFIDLIVMIAIHVGLVLLSIFTILQAIKDKGINQNMLKVIAVITMTIDHMGYFLFPEIRELRIIGRIAYPIFTYLFAMSFRYSSNRYKLLARLIAFAVLGNALIYLAGDKTFVNILFLFVLAWFAFQAIESKLGPLFYTFVILLMAVLAEYFKVDYGAYGILTLTVFYLCHDKKVLQFGLFALLTFLFSFQWLIENLITDARYWSYLPQIFGNGITSFTSYFPQIFAIMALIPLALYVYKAPKNKQALTYQFNQYFFYFYYPIHFAILAYISLHV
jgi:integral membrane protein (TIGR01906 family)